jgi:hypothetical protein
MAPNDDPHMKITKYKRTAEQNWSIGLTSDETPDGKVAEQLKTHQKDAHVS